MTALKTPNDPYKDRTSEENSYTNVGSGFGAILSSRRPSGKIEESPSFHGHIGRFTTNLEQRDSCAPEIGKKFSMCSEAEASDQRESCSGLLANYLQTLLVNTQSASETRRLLTCWLTLLLS